MAYEDHTYMKYLFPKHQILSAISDKELKKELIDPTPGAGFNDSMNSRLIGDATKLVHEIVLLEGLIKKAVGLGALYLAYKYLTGKISYDDLDEDTKQLLVDLGTKLKDSVSDVKQIGFNVAKKIITKSDEE